MDPIIYTQGIEGDNMGAPIGVIKNYFYIDDSKRLPTLTLTDTAGGIEYLCWRYVTKGTEFWKICRTTTITRIIIAGVSRANNGTLTTANKTITEKVVEYPFGRDAYNYEISELFIYPYYPLV
jgi:hypothetical protein